MRKNIPSSPFSTHLSGSSRALEQRIQNIVSGPKGRPPALFLALVFALCLLCGNLVSCQSAGAADEQGRNASVEVGSAEDTSRQAEGNGWQPVELKNFITAEWQVEKPMDCLTREQRELLEHLPAEELPRESVIPGRAQRQDYWRDMLLPAASDQAADVTVYFVVSPGSMPNFAPGASPDLYSLDRDGIVLRHGDRTAYFPLDWEINAKFGAPPLLVVDDLDGDGQPEAALALTWGEGTGCCCQCLYLFDLDTMTCTVPDYSELPLEITCSRDRTLGTLASGEKTWPLHFSDLGVPFQGAAEVGNQVRFVLEDGAITCHLDLDFSCNTLGYLAGARLPLVYEDGVYRFGPAVSLYDVL